LALALHPFEPMLDTYSQPADRALGLSESLTNLASLDPFAAHFERCRLAAEGFQPRRCLILLRRRHFPRGVPTLGAVVGGPFGALPHRDQREQALQAV